MKNQDLKIQELGEKRNKGEVGRDKVRFSGTDILFIHNYNLRKSKGCFGQSYGQKEPGYYDKDKTVK
jgi:hypothetical protein